MAVISGPAGPVLAGACYGLALINMPLHVGQTSVYLLCSLCGTRLKFRKRLKYCFLASQDEHKSHKLACWLGMYEWVG